MSVSSSLAWKVHTYICILTFPSRVCFSRNIPENYPYAGTFLVMALNNDDYDKENDNGNDDDSFHWLYV